MTALQWSTLGLTSVSLCLVACSATPVAGSADGGTAAPTLTRLADAAPVLGGGRDWRQIDRNGDHLVSPEEMEAWLKANPGPQR